MDGKFDKMYMLKKLFDASSSSEEYVEKYALRMIQLLEKLDYPVIAETICVLEEAAERGSSIYIAANGGSAAVASHLVNDLRFGAFSNDNPPFKVFSLTDNVESLTAIANDIGYQAIFTNQLRSGIRKKDVLLVMSVSGNSGNILQAVEYAKKVGVYVIGWTSFEGGKLGEMSDVVVKIPTTLDEYGPVEDIFSILGHMMTGYLSMKRGKEMYQSKERESPTKTSGS
jgi:D-sedoheptulose 7-phosphate isomerase